MGKKVLIVDDSSTMRKIVTRSLRQAGLDFEKIVEAGDGQEALQVLENEQVDIILSDINMPNMDGIEFLRQKSTNSEIAGIPVPLHPTRSTKPWAVFSKRGLPWTLQQRLPVRPRKSSAPC